MQERFNTRMKIKVSKISIPIQYSDDYLVLSLVQPYLICIIEVNRELGRFVTKTAHICYTRGLYPGSADDSEI